MYICLALRKKDIFFNYTTICSFLFENSLKHIKTKKHTPYDKTSYCS